MVRRLPRGRRSLQVSTRRRPRIRSHCRRLTTGCRSIRRFSTKCRISITRMFNVGRVFGKFIIALAIVASADVLAQTGPLEAELAAHPDKMGTRLQLANAYLNQSNYDKVIQLLNSYTDQLKEQGFLALASSYS